MNPQAPKPFKPAGLEWVKPEYYPETTFRPNTHMHKINMSFVFVNGGMGDYICWMPAIQWLMQEAKWLRGNLLVPKYFKELAEYWLKDYPEWKHHDYREMEQIKQLNDMAFRGPVELNRESLNATGAHLLTCGWVYFTNREGPPSEAWDRYPHIDQAYLDKVELPAEAMQLYPQKYAVITTGQTTNSRKSPKGSWNPIVEYIRDLGLTPVFLGRSVVETGNAKNIHADFNDGTRTDLGLNLLDKTTLTQAASIMSRAALVVGHDNGLLHLAACTDVPIVFGYNIAAPVHRKPRRSVGRIYDVTLTHKELSCIHCQSNNNFVIGYNFRECFYKDLKCMSMLFADNGQRWKSAIDEALRKTK